MFALQVMSFASRPKCLLLQGFYFMKKNTFCVTKKKREKKEFHMKAKANEIVKHG